MSNFSIAVKCILRVCLEKFAMTKLGSFFHQNILTNSINQTKTVSHNNIELTFYTPNPLCKWRVQTFSTKEPETLEWIDSIPKDSVFWDIGSNIGLYSCYAALKSKCQTYSFEPSVFNLELLAKNISLNNVVSRVSLMPFALNEASKIDVMRMTNTNWGGALSTFSASFDSNGDKFQPVFQYQILGFSFDDVINILQIPAPDFVKIDVDGLEHLILRGARKNLSRVKSILLEINESFQAQHSEAIETLKLAGFELQKKIPLSNVDFNNTLSSESSNQIWVNKSLVSNQ
jgi:FkbM family methyltransferase